MRTLVKPVLIVLAIPVLVSALGMLARSDWDSRWSDRLGRQLATERMRPDARLLARYSLATLCSDRRTAARMPPCRTYGLFSTAIRVSAVVGGAGFALLGLLALAAYLSSSSRRRLVWMFRPSVLFAAGGTAVLAVANALLAVVGVLVASAYLTGRTVEGTSVSLLLVVGTTAVVWAIAMVVVAFSLTRRPMVTVIGLVLDPAVQGGLVAEVGRVAASVGAPVPVHFVASLAPCLFVTEARIACLDGVLSGRTLCVSLPLGRILTIDEFRALLAHELAHFSRDEEGYSHSVGPFLEGTRRALDRLGHRSHGVRVVATAPPLAIFGFFMDALGDGTGPGEDRELAADRAAAAVAGREPLGSALVKFQAFAPAWHGVIAVMQAAVAGRTQYVNSGALFQEIVASNTGADRLIGIGQREQEHPTDSHPTLARRLTALDLDLAQVAAAALVTSPVPASVGLVDGYETLEQRLSAAAHQFIAVTGEGMEAED